MRKLVYAEEEKTQTALRKRYFIRYFKYLPESFHLRTRSLCEMSSTNTWRLGRKGESGSIEVREFLRRGILLREAGIATNRVQRLKLLQWTGIGRHTANVTNWQ